MQKIPLPKALPGALLAAALLAMPGRAEEESRTLTDVAEIRGLSPEQLAKKPPVQLRGVVTYRQRDGEFVLDDGAGIFIRWPAPRAAGVPLVELGDLVEVRGRASRGYYAPIVQMSGLRVAERTKLPPPLAVSGAELGSGKLESQRVALLGIVQWVYAERNGTETEQRVEMIADGQRVLARLSSAETLDGARLIDAEVRVTGVGSQELNTRREIVGAAVHVNRPEDFVVLRAAPEAPWETPLSEIRELGSFRAEGTPLHRVRVRGVVSLGVPGEYFYLQDGATGLRVQTHQADTLAPGDAVEVLGFIGRGNHFAELRNAVFRQTGGEPPPKPVAIESSTVFAADIGPRHGKGADLDGRLVVLRGPLQSVEKSADGGARLYVLSDGQSITAMVAAGPGVKALWELEPGSEVQVTGVCVIDLDTTVRFGRVPPRVTRFRLLLRDARDVAVLRRAPWWTPLRLQIALGAVLFAAALVLGWSFLLRRMVARQTAIIAEKTGREVLLDERHRMARELHDTIAQHLTGVRMQIQTAEHDLHEAPEEARISLATAMGMLRFSEEEVRRSVWSLRTRSLEEGGLAAAIGSLFPQRDSGPQIEITTEGAVRRLPAMAEFQLLRIAQEAVTNALKHAGAQRIGVVVAFAPDGVALTVCDDGCGFDPARAATDDTPHFGLLGLRERANKINGRLAIESRPGGGTRLTVRVPAAATDPTPA